MSRAIFDQVKKAEDEGKIHSWWNGHFPKSVDEAQRFKAETRWLALSSHVLVAMRTRIEFAWAAYIDAVPGMDHRYEFQEVLRVGTKLREDVARALFPEMDSIPYAK
jgi:hypothetical protein